MIPLNNNINKTFSPPIEEAFNWLENIKTPKNLKLLNLSQAAPMHRSRRRRQEWRVRQLCRVQSWLFTHPEVSRDGEATKPDVGRRRVSVRFNKRRRLRRLAAACELL